MTRRRRPDQAVSVPLREQETTSEDASDLPMPVTRPVPALIRLGRGALFAAAFAIPLVLLALVLIMGNRGESRQAEPSPTPTALPPSPTVSGAWPPDVTFAAHTIPAIIHDELTDAQPRRGYLFSGARGTSWMITVEPLPGSGLLPHLLFYGPAGDLLASGSSLTTILPEDGAYRVVVEAAPSGAATGAYRLSVFSR